MLNQKNACLMHATYRCTCNLCQAEQDRQKMDFFFWCLLVCGFCCRYLCHLPRSRHSVSSHCQPLQPTVLTSISHFIMSHHNSRRWKARRSSALLGVARRHRCLQVSTFTDLSVARRIRSVGSVGRRWQPQRAAAAGAGGRAMGWTTPPHHIPPRSLKCSSPEHTKNRQNKTEDL